MSKTMLVNVVNEEESRIAIVSGGLLEELSIETSRHEQIEGNIYKARIVKVVASLDAVFVDYGRERNGFLAVPDIHPRYFANGDRAVSRLKKGQEMLVQVRKGEIGQKGAALTTYVSIPGRYFVLMPFVTKRGVSRKIQDDATRQQLRQILDDAGVPEDMGYIARTAAEGRTRQDLHRDASYLVRLWKRIQSQEESSKAPALLYQDSDIVIRTIRDYFTPSIREVLVDDKEIFEQVQSFFQAVMPWHQKRVRLYQGKGPLFSKYNLEAQIASIYEKTVPLPSGGSIVIEQTEALVSIDVNSGKTTKGKDIEETAFIANREAAEEAVRQLRLRDLGGLVVIDFIDMRSTERRNEIRKVLQKALKEDKARTDTGTISKFGMLELSRQRIKSAGSIGVTTPCPVCGGKGKVRSPESFALSILRRVQSELARAGSVGQVLVGVPQEAATLLLNRKRAKIVELEADFKASVAVFGEAALQPNQYYIEYREGTAKRIETNVSDGFPRSLLKTPEGLPEVAARTPRPPSYALFEEEEPPEVPAEPPDEAEAPAPGAGAGPSVEEEKPAKKKRRRRRKKKTDETPAAPAAEEAEEQQPPAPVQHRAEAPPAPPPAAQAAAAAPPEAAAEETGAAASQKLSPSAKRRLRRKRRKVREAGGAPEAEAAAETPAPAAEPPSTVAESAAEPAPEAAEAPAEEAPPRKRRRSRSRKKPASAPAEAPDQAPAAEPEATPEAPAAAPAPEPAPPAEPVPAAAAPAEAASAPADEAGEAPPPKKRRTRKKPAAPPAEKPAPAEAPPTEEPPAASPAADAEPPAAPPKRPARRTRTPRAKKAATEAPADPGTAETAPAPEAESAGPAESEAGTEVPAAPKKRRAPRRKKAAAEPAEEKTSSQGEGGDEPS